MTKTATRQPKYYEPHAAQLDADHICTVCNLAVNTLHTIGPSGYAWMITEDRISQGDQKTRIGTIGPRGTGLCAADFANQQTTRFRLKDDDGQTYYEGVFVGDHTSEEAFGPLDDFGTPDAGCTRLEYRYPDGRWRPL